MAKKKIVEILIIVFLLQFTFNEIHGQDECGTTLYTEDRLYAGSVSSVGIGEWPFLAALYHSEGRKFFCGGTLITQQNVLTGMNAT